MHIDLIGLKNRNVNEIKIDSDYSFSKEKLNKVGILDLQNGKVFGTINNDYCIDLTISGIMILPCSLTLKPVKHKFETKISGKLEEIISEIGLNFTNYQNSIDILPIIWENILVEIPMKIICEEANIDDLQGEGWKVIQERKEKTNPELEKLKDLLKEEV